MHMHRLFPGFSVYRYPVYPIVPTVVAGASTGMSPSGTMSAPRTPQTTMQQIMGILTPSFTRETPLITSVPRARTPLEAAQTLRTIQQAQWGSMIGSIGSEYSMEQRRAAQERLMGLERQAHEQLERLGYPVRLRIQ